ncbi:hypothetical protein OAO87_00860 [bacterium]|nr:hypothetical protein [bacterium]
MAAAMVQALRRRLWRRRLRVGRGAAEGWWVFRVRCALHSDTRGGGMHATENCVHAGWACAWPDIIRHDDAHLCAVTGGGDLCVAWWARARHSGL